MTQRRSEDRSAPFAETPGPGPEWSGGRGGVGSGPVMAHPPVPSRRGWSIAYQVVGVLLTLAAAVGSWVGVILVMLVTSRCHVDPPPGQLRDLRVGLAVVGVGCSAVPLLWAAFGSWRRMTWWPWLVVGAMGLAVTLQVVVQARVENICMY